MRHLKIFWRLLSGLAGELSDEAAYARHLRLSGLKHSAQVWRAFADQRHARKYSSAKCC